MTVRTSGAIGRAVADYTGDLVHTLSVVADPVVEGVYAVQATVGKRLHKVQFLIRDVELDRVTAEDLEEVDFATWPPVTVC